MLPTAMRLHHPITLSALVEAWILDRLSVAPTGDRDRPSLRLFPDRRRAEAEALTLQEAGDGAHPAEGLLGATIAFDRTVLASALTLLSVREDRSDLAEDEDELRARTDLRGWRGRAALIHVSDEDIDACIAAYAGGHPEDDGSGRLTAAARAALEDIYADPRRIPPEPVAFPRRR